MGKYPYIEAVSDKEQLLNHLSEQALTTINSILKDYSDGIIDFKEPTDSNGEYLFCGEAELICEKDYEPNGLEVLVMRWYESHESTEHLIYVFQDDVG